MTSHPSVRDSPDVELTSFVGPPCRFATCPIKGRKFKHVNIFSDVPELYPTLGGQGGKGVHKFQPFRWQEALEPVKFHRHSRDQQQKSQNDQDQKDWSYPLKPLNIRYPCHTKNPDQNS
jgi:hypothetical protein